MMHRNRSVDVHQFAMVPKADIPRSAFRMQFGHKTAFDSGYLVPVMCEEVLPGDTWSLKMTAFARLATPIFPFMDNLYLESFFFFVPNRLVWTNWAKFMGEQDNPGDSISFTIPQLVSTVGGYAVGSLYDYFGLPTAGQVAGGNTVTHSALPLRGYNLIYNQWFRDQNLVPSQSIPTGDGPDNTAWYTLRRRGKRHDYFTSCLPWVQKGNTAVSLPLGTSAVVKTSSTTTLVTGAQPRLHAGASDGTTIGTNTVSGWAASVSGVNPSQIGNMAQTTPTAGVGWYPSNLYADLSTATAATINQLRTSFQIQKLLERDARGGTRYTEIVRSHFGVVSPDARLQRPEYLGGGSTPIIVNPIAQTSATGVTGGSTAAGSLSGVGTALAHGHGFSQSFTEHGHIFGIVCVRADLTYQQGLRKMWSRQTRVDHYFPAFAALGEQSVLNKEIYCDGSANDALTFGYQERWAEYRYGVSKVTGLMRSTSASTIDPWHLAQKFTSLPVLNATFIQEQPPIPRVSAVGAGAAGQELIFDSFFDAKVARPMPLYSVPGLVDHF